MKIIGKDTILKGSWEKALGKAKYTTDITFPGMLYGKMLRSSSHYARIKRVDVSKAKELPGVMAVVTAKDIKPVKYGFLGAGKEHCADQYPLAVDIVRFKGDEIAAVAAVDPDTAEEALELIEVEYEDLTPVFDVEKAIEEGAPQLHDDALGNVAERLYIEKGDVDRAFEEADYVFENTYRTHRTHQMYLEPAGCVANWEGDKVTLWVGGMNTSGIHRMLAKVLDLPLSKVRVIQPHTGGSFGSKVTLQSIYPVACYLSKMSGRPVKMINSREEEFFAARPHLSSVVKVKTAVKKDGTILAREVLLLNDGGAYCEMAPAMLIVMSHRSDNVYRIPNIRTDARLVYTNKSPIGAYRGYGNQQMTFAFESQLDLIAKELNIDRVELRKKNATRQGDITVHGWHINSCGLVECIDKVAEDIGWEKKRSLSKPYYGIGIGCAVHEGDDRHTDGFAGSNASIEIRPDGTALLVTGEGEYGQGSQTMSAQCAAEVLGIPVEKIDVTFPDTDKTPFALGPWGSRITISAGNAARLAAEDARNKLFEVASDMLEARKEDLDIDNERIFVKGLKQRGVTIAEVATEALHRKNGCLIVGYGTEEPDTIKMDPTKQTNPCSAYSYGAAAAEVEVDPQTGQVNVLSISTCVDAGTILNPFNAMGQCMGQLVQAIGYVLQEEIKYKGGDILNPGILGMGTPQTVDVPPLSISFADIKDPYGPYGAKGVAEIGLIPVIGAIANAVSRALDVEINHLPLTPENILRIIREKHRKGEDNGKTG